MKINKENPGESQKILESVTKLCGSGGTRCPVTQSGPHSQSGSDFSIRNLHISLIVTKLLCKHCQTIFSYGTPWLILEFAQGDKKGSHPLSLYLLIYFFLFPCTCLCHVSQFCFQNLLKSAGLEATDGVMQIRHSTPVPWWATMMPLLPPAASCIVMDPTGKLDETYFSALGLGCHSCQSDISN